MKKLAVVAFAAIVSLSMGVIDAEAKRLGGGKSFGMQRSDNVVRRDAAPTSPQVPPRNAAPAAAPQPGAAVPPVAQKRSWLGPLAGLAAGIGLAALLSHFGMGEQAASFMMILLGIFAVVMVVKLLFRSKAPQQPAGAFAGGAPAPVSYPAEPVPASAPILATGAAASSSSEAAVIPADFDTEAFVREAKLNFIRLQAANDAGNLDDIREFTSPELFAEIRMQFDERGGKAQRTDIVNLNAAVLDVAEEGKRHVVSTRFYGALREDENAPPEQFDEVWHLTKPVDGSRGWVVAGIQQRH